MNWLFETMISGQIMNSEIVLGISIEIQMYIFIEKMYVKLKHNSIK